MGIPLSQAILLIREAKREPLHGSIIQLGKQDLSFSDRQFRKIAQNENFTLNLRSNSSILNVCAEKKNGGYLSDFEFLEMLGFSSINSLDIDSFEGADIIHDMNSLISKDQGLDGKYDVVFDGGTMEHVFHVPNFLSNCITLLKKGGRIIHSVPVDMINHGFYNFCPTLFEDFYSHNDFQINQILIMKTKNYQIGKKVFITDARRGSRFDKSLNSGSLDKGSHILFVIATKLAENENIKIPMQGYYSYLFKGSENFNNSGLVEGDSLIKTIYQFLLKIPILGILMKRLRNFYADSIVSWEKLQN